MAGELCSMASCGDCGRCDADYGGHTNWTCSQCGADFYRGRNDDGSLCDLCAFDALFVPRKDDEEFSAK